MKMLRSSLEEKIMSVPEEYIGSVFILANDFYVKCGFEEFDRRYSHFDKRNYILMMRTF